MMRLVPHKKANHAMIVYTYASSTSANRGICIDCKCCTQAAPIRKISLVRAHEMLDAQPAPHMCLCSQAKDAEPKWERPASGGPPYRGMVMTTSIPAVSDGAPSPTSTAISDIRTPITPPPKRTASVRAAFASLARLKPPVRPRQRVKPGAPSISH